MELNSIAFKNNHDHYQGFRSSGNEIIRAYAKDLKKKPRYLLTFIVGCDHRNNIDASIKKIYGHNCRYK
ncbi:hypothetical protein L2E82_06899 [Cichorium intybus]|uniref:Uncharacterized protein n=1 Tax=Cichorium intybus TaxID=13427 RepID=A0ACB9G3E7_CICIN|nr:hypothetical protein L2E82_06899 [Cichorium intybus]